MYKSFRVKNFRCFKDLQINDLGRVNLIAGKNNTGKTALLEAMYLQTQTVDSQAVLLTSSKCARGLDFRARCYQLDRTLEAVLFHGMDCQHRSTLKSKLLAETQRYATVIAILRNTPVLRNYRLLEVHSHGYAKYWRTPHLDIGLDGCTPQIASRRHIGIQYFFESTRQWFNDGVRSLFSKSNADLPIFVTFRTVVESQFRVLFQCKGKDRATALQEI